MGTSGLITMARNWPREQNAARRRKALPGIQGTSANGSDHDDTACWIRRPGQRVQPQRPDRAGPHGKRNRNVGLGPGQRQGQLLATEQPACSGTTQANLARHSPSRPRRFTPTTRGPCRPRLTQHLRGETASYRTEFRVLRKDGTYAWFESRGMVVEHGPNGEPWRMIGTHIDISDRKANEQLRRDLEAALRRNRDELEAMVRQQTQKLVDAADAAELGHRAKNALLANLGEEFRAPLDVVTDTSARLLAGGSGEVPPDMREPLERIQRAGRLLSDTLQRLLDVRSIETERPRPVPDPGQPAPRPRGAVRGGGEPGPRTGHRPADGDLRRGPGRLRRPGPAGAGRT